MLKKILSLVLAGIMVFSLSACGSAKSNPKPKEFIEMQDEEAKSIIEFKFTGFDVSKGQRYDSTPFMGSTLYRYRVRAYYDMVIRDEYKNDYVIDKIMSYNLGPVNKIISGAAYKDYCEYSFDKEKLQFAFNLETESYEKKLEVMLREYDISYYSSPEEVYNLLNSKDKFKDDLINKERTVLNCISNIRINFGKLG